MKTYLPDTSVWSWAQDERRPDIATRFARRFAEGRLVTCAPVILETMHRARDRDEFETVYRTFFEPLELIRTRRSEERALEVHRALAEAGGGGHRRSAADFLIAAIAEQAGVVLWHFDRDLDVICRHTGQPQEYEGAAS